MTWILAREGVIATRLVETQLSFPAYCFVASGLGVTVAEPFSALLFARLGVCVRRFEPTVTLNFTLLESENMGPPPEAVVQFRDIVRRQTVAHLERVRRLTTSLDEGGGI